MPQPNTIYFDPNDDVVYVAGLDHEFLIYTLEGELITRWGGAESSEVPASFSVVLRSLEWTRMRPLHGRSDVG